MAKIFRPVTTIFFLLFLTAVEPFIILQPATTATTATTGTTGTTTTTTGTVGQVGTLGTLTLGTSTLGTGLASLGVLGALKLGVIAIAAKLAAFAGFALAKKLHYKEPASEYNSYTPSTGHHYVPHVYTSGYGGGGGGYGAHHYHKRSLRGIDGEEQHEEDHFASMVLSEEEAFSLVHESDESRCGERLVCELATRSRYGLLSDEESLLSLIKQKPTGSSYGTDGSRTLYYNAMKAGYRRKNCHRLFPSCPFNSQQIMALVRSMGRDLIHDPVSFIASSPDEQTLHPGQALTSPVRSTNPFFRHRRVNTKLRQKLFGGVIKKQLPSYKKEKAQGKAPRYEHIGYRKS